MKPRANELFLVALIAGVTPAMTQAQQPERNQSRAASAQQEQHNVTARQISLNPERFYNQNVKISAPVEQVFNQHIIVLDENHLVAGPDLIVFNPNPSESISRDSEIQVSGIVKGFQAAEFKRDFEWFDSQWTEQGPLKEWRGRPVIVATSVTASLGGQFVQAQTQRETRSQRASQQRTQAQQQSQNIIVATTEAIAASPQRFYGKKVRVQSEVETTYGSTVFTLDEDAVGAGPDVLVITPGGAIAPREDTQATVTGTVREFASADIYSDYDWYGYGWYGYDWNYYNDVWAEWSYRPVIVADSVVTEEGRELVAQKSQGKPGQRRERNLVYLATPGAIAAEAENYFGHSVMIRAGVAESYNPHAFTLDEDRLFVTDDLLVFVPRPKSTAVEGNEVTVIGVVQPFDRARLQNQRWFSPNLLPDDDFEEWEEERRPVVIARSVRTANGRELVQSPSRPATEAMGGTAESPGETQRGERGNR